MNLALGTRDGKRAYLWEFIDCETIVVIDSVHCSSVDSPNLICINLVSKVKDARHAGVANKLQNAIFRVNFVQNTVQGLCKILAVLIYCHSVQIATAHLSKRLVVDVLFDKTANDKCELIIAELRDAYKKQLTAPRGFCRLMRTKRWAQDWAVAHSTRVRTLSVLGSSIPKCQ